jgi:hypothetical protein
MALHSFTPATKIESAKVNSNFTNFSNHALNVTMKWTFPDTLIVENSADYIALPDNILIERVDLMVATAPTGASIIVDIDRSTDSGGTWITIFTNQSNRPQISAGARVGSTTTIDVSSGTKLTHYYRACIDQVGSTVAGANLSVMVRGKYVLD